MQMIDLVETENGINKLQKDTIREYEKFRIDTKERINYYERDIAELKLKTEGEKTGNSDWYQKNWKLWN